MESFHTDNDLLISLVRKRPVLWDKSADGFKSRPPSAMAWKEVCSGLKENYDDLEDAEKELYGRQVIKRWTNLKDCYWRFVKKNDKTNRPYKYNRELGFLQKNRPQNDSSYSASVSHESCSSGSDNFQEPEIIEMDVLLSDTEKFEETESGTGNTDNITSSPLPEESYTPRKRRQRRVAEKVEDPTVMEDRHISFFKGILPTLQLLNEDEVLQFQIEVLRILQEIKSSKQQDPSSSR